jgi:hypothetical protein
MQDILYHFEHRNIGVIAVMIVGVIVATFIAMWLLNLLINANFETQKAMVIICFIEVLIGIEVYKILKRKLGLE